MKYLLLEHLSPVLPGRVLFPFLPYILSVNTALTKTKHEDDFDVCLKWMKYFHQKHVPFIILFESDPDKSVMQGGRRVWPHFQLWKELIEWEGNIEQCVYEDLLRKAVPQDATPGRMVQEQLDEFWEIIPEHYVTSELNKIVAGGSK